MPFQPQDSPLGAFLKALREEKIDCILTPVFADPKGHITEQGAANTARALSFGLARIPRQEMTRLLYQ